MWATLPLRVAAMAGPQRAAASPGSMLGVPVSVLPVCAIIIVDSTVIFGYLALLTELSRVCEGAPPNVVLHNFDVTPLTILGIASPLNL